jgi:outer membrane lipoprotein-sorting protein
MLIANQKYSYSARQFITTWRDDGSIFATIANITHLAPSLDKIEYTEPRSRRGVTIIEDVKNNQEWTYLPMKNIVIHSVLNDFSTLSPGTSLKMILTNYVLTSDKISTQVEGRKADILTIRRKHENHPFEKLWIDPYTGLALRQEKFSSDGDISSVSYIDQVGFHINMKPSDFTPKSWVTKRAKTVEKISQTEIVVSPDRLPEPFHGKVIIKKSLDTYLLVGTTILQRGQGKSLHLLYSDGLNPLSIYATPRHTLKTTKMAGSRVVQLTKTVPARALQRYSYWLVNWDEPGMTYTVAGDINLSGILQVARAELGN